VVGTHDGSLTNEVTIIIGRKGSVGEVHLSPQGCWPIDTTYFIDEFSCGLPPAYWALFLESLRLGQQDKSSAIPGISRDDIYEIEIPLPPLNEQRRIVAKLEKLLDKVDSCQKRLAKIPILLKRFRQAVLAAACSGQLTEDWRDTNGVDDEWPIKPLDALFTMRNGKSLTAARQRDGDIPVFGGNGRIGNHNEANAEGLVIVIGRVGAQCGNVHYVSGKLWVTDNAISLQAKREVVPAFYAYFLRSQNLNQLSGGTVQPYVSQEILGPIETPIVSTAEQQEIVRRVDELLALADRLEARYTKEKLRVDSLKQSILAKAFHGELVPQDPNDEPATVLLERIREARASQQSDRRRSRSEQSGGTCHS
jgi:type I restriction enzyme, S subunit